MVPDWFKEANCAGLPRDVFFSDDSGDIDSAKRICGRCVVQMQCLAFAFEAESTIKAGIFGGTTGEERVKFAKEHGYKPKLSMAQQVKALRESMQDMETYEEDVAWGQTS